MQAPYYLEMHEVSFADKDIYIQVGQEWFRTEALRSNEKGLYVYRGDVLAFGSRVSAAPEKWKCPYCHHWSKFGEKCQNPDCPTNQWEQSE